MKKEIFFCVNMSASINIVIRFHTILIKIRKMIFFSKNIILLKKINLFLKFNISLNINSGFF